MTNPFSEFSGSYAPIIAWTFFNNEDEANKVYNSSTWEGWLNEWLPLASNELGDAIILVDGKVYEIEHGTGNPAELSQLISDHIYTLIPFLIDLLKFEESTPEDNFDILREKKKELQSLKKQAPKSLKHHFTDAIDDIKDLIEDLRWKKSAAGKLQTYVDEHYKKWEDEIHNKWDVDQLMIRRHVRNKAICIVGSTHENNIKEVIDYLSQSSKYPVENLLNIKS